MREVSGAGELEKLACTVNGALGEVKLVCEALYKTSGFSEGLFSSFGRCVGSGNAATTLTSRQTDPAIGADIASLDHGSTTSSLAKLDFGHNVALIGNSTTCLAGPVDDIWVGAVLVRTLTSPAAWWLSACLGCRGYVRRSRTLAGPALLPCLVLNGFDGVGPRGRLGPPRCLEAWRHGWCQADRLFGANANRGELDRGRGDLLMLKKR